MSPNAKKWLILIVLACIWGSSFILMKKGMFTDEGTPIFSDSQVGAMRMFLAGFVLLPFSLGALSKLRDIRTLGLLAIVGFCGNFFPAFLFTYAETGVSSGYAGMLNSFTPIFALIIGGVVFRDKLTRIQLLGVAIGTVGVVLLMLAGKDLSISGGWSHIFAILVATLCYAISLNTIKHTLSGLSSFEITSLAFFIVLAPSGVIAFLQGSVDTFETNPHALEGFVYIAILSVIGTAFAVVLFNKLVAVSSVLFASSVTYLIPVVAVVIGLWFKETISWAQIGAMIIVVGGVFVANVLGRKSSKAKH